MSFYDRSGTGFWAPRDFASQNRSGKGGIFARILLRKIRIHFLRQKCKIRTFKKSADFSPFMRRFFRKLIFEISHFFKSAKMYSCAAPAACIFRFFEKLEILFLIFENCKFCKICNFAKFVIFEAENCFAIFGRFRDFVAKSSGSLGSGPSGARPCPKWLQKWSQNGIILAAKWGILAAK